MNSDARFDIEELAPDLARLRIAFVNVFFAGSPRAEPSARPWALVDAGLAIGASPRAARALAADDQEGGRLPAADVPAG